MFWQCFRDRSKKENRIKDKKVPAAQISARPVVLVRLLRHMLVYL